MRSINVLVSSAGRRVALLECFRAALGDLGLAGQVLAADASLLTAAGLRADSFSQVPLVRDPSYRDRLSDLCREQRIGLLVPTIDTELDAIAAMRDDLQAAGTHALVSGPATVALSLDKVATHRFLSENHLPAPTQWSGPDSLDMAPALPYPVIVKPRAGSASKGITIVGHAEDLRHVSPDDSCVVQQLVAGQEFTIDVWADSKGAVRAAIPRRRLEVRAGEVSKGMTQKHPAVMDAARATVAALPDAYGPITVQVIAKEDSVAVIEVNPRFGGGFPLAWQAGAGFPRWALQDALGQPNTPRSFEWQDRLVMLRFDDAVFVEASKVGL